MGANALNGRFVLRGQVIAMLMDIERAVVGVATSRRDYGVYTAVSITCAMLAASTGSNLRAAR